MTAATVPDPPTGYRPYSLDSDPSIGIVARILALGWVLAVVVFGGLVLLNHEQYTAVGVLVVVLVTTVVHEVIHAVVGWVVGLELTAGFDIAGLASGPYILPYGEFQTRRETALLAAAPTLVLTPVLLVLAVVGGTATALAALAALFVNTIGAVGDLRVVLTTLLLPAGALEFHTSEGKARYYARAESGSLGR